MEGAVVDNLKTRGIASPSLNWIRACVDWLRQEEGPNLSIGQLKDLVYEQWLYSDITDTCTAGSLPLAITNTPKGTLTNIYIVQVVSSIDIGVSAYSQLMTIQGRELDAVPSDEPQTQHEVKPSRMLLLTLTDGHTTCNAMEYSTISQLPTPVLPGTKLSLCGPIQYRLGTLLLMGSHVTVLGGAVERLVQENTQQRVLARELNREDLIGQEGEATNSRPQPSSAEENIHLLPVGGLINSLMTGTTPSDTVYVKGTITRFITELIPSGGVWSLEATLADGTGELPVLLGNAPLEILIGFPAIEFHRRPRQQSEEGLRKCKDILYNIHCVMEIKVPQERRNKPTVTRLLDVQ